MKIEINIEETSKNLILSVKDEGPDFLKLQSKIFKDFVAIDQKALENTQV